MLFRARLPTLNSIFNESAMRSLVAVSSDSKKTRTVIEKVTGVEVKVFRIASLALR